ncbi:MAG TPA: hypothetical protein VGE77_05170, partial [Nocardioides sp.]
GPTYGAPPAASPSPDPPVQAPVDQPGNQPGNQPGAPVQQPWGQQPSGQQAPSSSPYPTYPPATPPYQPPPGSPYAGAAPYQGFGDPGRGPQGWQPPAPTRRPGAVLAACIATWIASGLVALTMIASVAAVVADPDFVMDEMRRTQPEALEQGITSDYLVGAVAVMGGFVVLWCLVACVLAVFTLRGRGWARILLLVSAGVAGLLCLVSVLVAPPAVVGVPAAALAFFCLLRSEVAAWFAARSRGRS